MNKIPEDFSAEDVQEAASFLMKHPEIKDLREMPEPFEGASIEQKVAWVHAQAAERVAKQAVTTVLARLSAAQSYYRMVERQT